MRRKLTWLVFLGAALVFSQPAHGQAWQATAGAQSPDKGRQAVAFLPNEVWIHAADSITWTFVTDEPHSVTFLQPGQVRPIRVRVDNYAQASPATLAEAEREAGRILGEAGLQTIWLDCPAGHSIAVPQDPCQEPLEATDIVLRVLSEPIQNRFPDTVFGFAVVPVLASVYYEYAVRRAKSDNAEFEVPIILGGVIAHEVGHLLLGSNSHSGSGLMKPRWEPKQIRQAMTGTLLFTPEQAKLIQAETQTRMRLQTASLKERPMRAVDHQVGPKAHSAE